MQNDTIVAVSTPTGVGGIAVVRLSGSAAMVLAQHYLSAATLHSRHATYCHFRKGHDVLDDVVATFYPAPHSYTGEDTVEIACHGSLYVQEAILQALIEAGARLATAGEFTLRAFRNGRMNLSQAEAVADLIASVDHAQHKLAISQLRGGYAKALGELRKQLVDLTSLLELELDFSDEDIEFADRTKLKSIVGYLKSNITKLTDSFAMGNAIKHGIPVAIIGRPNAGKSSLLNALVADDRAIVSAQPGTTRDTVEAQLTIDGIPFRIIDTAGLRASSDEVEQMGIERSYRAASEAKIVIYVHDSTYPKEEADNDIKDIAGHVDLHDKKCIIAMNKADLSGCANGISAKKSIGIEQLKKQMSDALKDELKADNVMLSNTRHYEALLRVNLSLNEVEKGLNSDTPADLISVDLRDALYHLGTITGEVTSQEILTNIFSRFCIGK